MCRPISILLLGTGNSGKTEIGYSLSGQPRLDFGSTKGVHIYNMNARCQQIRLTEIGGSDAVRDIWPYYYNDVRKLYNDLFERCFECTDRSEVSKSIPVIFEYPLDIPL